MIHRQLLAVHCGCRCIAAVGAPKRVRHEANARDGPVIRAKDGNRPFRRCVQGQLDRGRWRAFRERDGGARKTTSGLVCPDASRPKDPRLALTNDLELNVAGTIGLASLDNRFGVAGTARVREPDDDIDPGQTGALPNLDDASTRMMTGPWSAAGFAPAGRGGVRATGDS